MSYLVLSMYGWRSSHWPWNASAPPMPTGPTMSGPLPEASWVASVSRALAYGIGSKVSLIFGMGRVERLHDGVLDLDLGRILAGAEAAIPADLHEVRRSTPQAEMDRSIAADAARTLRRLSRRCMSLLQGRTDGRAGAAGGAGGGAPDGYRSTSTAGAFGRSSSATVESPSDSPRVIQRGRTTTRSTK